MAQMERNVNLEEIEADALLGIDALKGQTFFQKIIFFGTLLIGITINVALPMIYDTPKIVCIFIFVGLLLIGIAFGCNYTEDMTYGKYMYCFFFKPAKHLRYKSTEDIKMIKEKALELKKQEEIELQKTKAMDEGDRRKRLMKVIIIFAVLAVFLVSMVALALFKDDNVKHHVVTDEIVEVEEEN